MKALSEEVLVRQLQWRYATKKFDPARKIPAADWHTLEQAMVYAPSSYGLQPWHFFVVTDPNVRARLKLAAWKQPQIGDASHLVVFAIKKNLCPSDVERHIARTADVRAVPLESLTDRKHRMVGSLNRAVEEVNHWATRQVYIALGFFLSAAALLGIDACPMEGFEPDKFDDILDLTAKGFGSVVLATAGYRAADDAAANLPKVRFKTEDVITHI
jgi:nitroreductase